MNDKDWSDMIGGLTADALLDANIIQKDQFEDACEVIAEEVFVRLCLNDRPTQKDLDSMST
ncbi:hypothetical protein [Acaryochloris sp. IP29b_bin.148]|uniref:hypothetical protein n=1 Tax=Acaryochloris sp. IP29b_bin.148 TaxID=2969218 RepID=UPI0026341F43|nr:hypothetical protein [Acaryochloris sp. IP29b_bin.148]